MRYVQLFYVSCKYFWARIVKDGHGFSQCYSLSDILVMLIWIYQEASLKRSHGECLQQDSNHHPSNQAAIHLRLRPHDLQDRSMT